jgi:phosphoribosylamine--glycine ligase
MKKILVIGSGGREHAICEQFKKSPKLEKIFCLPGNAGISEVAEIVDEIKIDEHQKIIDFCQKNKIDFVFVGPEQPLVAGLIDDLEKGGIRAFGPNKNAAQLEGSKIFMKKIAVDNNVPTAIYETFTDEKSAIEFAKKLAKEFKFPCVIKTDGLAAGKGVIIPQNFSEAEETIKEIFAGKFGAAGNKIIIEEFLDGFEASYFVLCDGKNFIPLGFAHDHKRVGDGDTGPNTGGMGTYAPSPFIDKKLEEEIIEKIIRPTLHGIEFRGILFAGLMINKNTLEPLVKPLAKPLVKLLEYNVRFGDPETQVILPRIKTDFIDLIEAAIDGRLSEIKVEFDEEKKLVCVVMCANGYPENYEKGTEIKNLDLITEAKILHAGTIKKDGKILANGGRVLNIVAEATSFTTARDKAYKAIAKIDWNEGFCRKDIAEKLL